MRTMIAAALVLAAALPARAEKKPEIAEVDVVICIDRSGSMQQVIDTAKRKVWSIVNDIAKVRPTPQLRIGLIGYGSADREFKFFDLTDDLDGVYANLMTFKTDMGGEEWVGAAVEKATKEMSWSRSKEALRMIFMVGNETAMQGTPERLFTKTCPEAIKADIVVNAIYCGKPNADEEQSWRDVARLADGSYTTIDISGGAVAIATPMDEEMAKLNQELNGTYAAFGREGARKKDAQKEQDANAGAAGGAGVVAERAEAKASGAYRSSSWDLVDASKEKDFKLEEVAEEELPAEMRTMTPEERKAHIAHLSAERERIQAAIQEKAVARQKFIDEEMKKQGLNQDKSFDEAMRRMIRTQAAKKGLEMDKE
ncbi:MAG: VWA domain-containing protein [Candidatus Brocadiae bacterium]|nr:VWA domain-containing protein [Candidatus Brocadiia bacterium]